MEQYANRAQYHTPLTSLDRIHRHRHFDGNPDEVGEKLLYSNIGMDLAAYMIQVRTGKPYGQYLRERVSKPLNMSHSTTELARIKSDPNRAIGHQPHVKEISVLSDVSFLQTLTLSNSFWAESPCDHDCQASIPAALLADSTVLKSSMVIVIGPTPPGTGVMNEAFSLIASKSTSPTRR